MNGTEKENQAADELAKMLFLVATLSQSYADWQVTCDVLQAIEKVLSLERSVKSVQRFNGSIASVLPPPDGH